MEMTGEIAGVGLHLDEVMQNWNEKDRRECAVLWGRLFRESIIQQPLELIRRAAGEASLENALKNLDLQREEIIKEVIASAEFLSKKIKSPIDITAKDLSEIINQERNILIMAIKQNNENNSRCPA